MLCFSMITSILNFIKIMLAWYKYSPLLEGIKYAPLHQCLPQGGGGLQVRVAGLLRLDQVGRIRARSHGNEKRR